MRINSELDRAHCGWHSRLRRSAAATLLLLFAGAASAVAQDDTDAPAWFNGVSVGIPGYGDEVASSLFTVGFHGARIQHGRPGFDYSVGTMPRALMEGLFVLGARAGVVLPLALSQDVVLLPSGGGSFIGGVGPEGGGSAFGGNLGVGMFMLSGGVRGLRVGVTWHKFREADGVVWLFEFGFVRSS